ncbi:hypothetical protein [Paenibacillus validus]|uniref:hypothetical protein n=1 Tax=Paenibacillus validus TaxID=44253 RepID=UPI003D2C7706
MPYGGKSRNAAIQKNERNGQGMRTCRILLADRGIGRRGRTAVWSGIGCCPACFLPLPMPIAELR